MRKLLMILFVLTLPLSAAPILVGIFGGNDSEASVEAALGGLIDLTLYDKSDGLPVLTVFTPPDPAGALTGTWDVIDDAVLISYMTIKGSDKYALYQIDPAANFGDWTTAGIINGGGQQPGLSHLSLWTTPITETPEPGSWVLMGVGLIAVTYRLRSKRA